MWVPVRGANSEVGWSRGRNSVDVAAPAPDRKPTLPTTPAPVKKKPNWEKIVEILAAPTSIIFSPRPTVPIPSTYEEPEKDRSNSEETEEKMHMGSIPSSSCALSPPMAEREEDGDDAAPPAPPLYLPVGEEVSVTTTAYPLQMASCWVPAAERLGAATDRVDNRIWGSTSHTWVPSFPAPPQAWYKLPIAS